MRVLSYLRALWRNRRRRTDQPRFLTYTVTFACNAKCIMCDSWKIPSPEDLNLDEIARIFDQLPRMDAVRLTGGEPFVRRDMPEICRLVQEKLQPLAVHVTTNGFLTDRIVSFCEQRRKDRPLHVLISMDGLKEKHNSIRGTENAFTSCVKTIEALAPRRKELRLELAVNQTIVDADGVEQYQLLRDFLRKYGVHNNMVMAYDVSATYSVERDVNLAPTEIGQFSTFGEFTADHLRTLIREVENDLPNYPFWERIAKRYYLRGIANRLLHKKGVPNPPCVALNAHLRIFPNGDVPTCQFNSKVVGNLRRQPFAEVWASATMREMRDWVRRCPGCWAECEVLPSAVYTGDLLREFFSGSPSPPPEPPAGGGPARERVGSASADARVSLPVIN